jgi:hypothetical protein
MRDHPGMSDMADRIVRNSVWEDDVEVSDEYFPDIVSRGCGSGQVYRAARWTG